MTLRKDGSGGAELDNFPKVDDVVANRNGDVLIKNTLLKADHFPGKMCTWPTCLSTSRPYGSFSSIPPPWSYLTVVLGDPSTTR
jgi:hypothetical protein